jgi:hypothetical protein
MDRGGMEALQREWAAQVAQCDDAQPWALTRIGGLDVHWVDDARGDHLLSSGWLVLAVLVWYGSGSTAAAAPCLGAACLAL